MKVVSPASIKNQLMEEHHGVPVTVRRRPWLKWLLLAALGVVPLFVLRLRAGSAAKPAASVVAAPVAAPPSTRPLEVARPPVDLGAPGLPFTVVYYGPSSARVSIDGMAVDLPLNEVHPDSGWCYIGGGVFGAQFRSVGGKLVTVSCVPIGGVSSQGEGAVPKSVGRAASAGGRDKRSPYPGG